MSSKTQAKLVQLALEKAAKADLRVWSVTADGTSVNTGMFTEIGCNFTASFDSMLTKFKHPTENYYVYAVLTLVTCLNSPEMHWDTSLSLLTMKTT